MKSLVIDTSVAIKWYFDEDLKDTADEIFEQIGARQIKAIVPEIFFLEFSNACWVKVKKKLVLPSVSQSVSGEIVQLPLTRHLHEVISDVAFDYSLELNVSVYDAAYLTLAEIYGVPLITADKKLVEACEGKFEYIEYLGDISVA